jgi:iron complex outermembrane receptor protein
MLALVIALATLSPATAHASDNDATDQGTIVVTGTKQGSSVQETRQSVVVLRPEDTVGFLQTFDAFTRVPNVVLTRENTLPTVRGLDGNGAALGGGGAVTGASARMTSYIDGVARTFSAVPDGFGSMWDLSQIEILRGSQSTTFGQNAVAGAMVQVTNDPAFKNEAALQAGARSAGATFNGAFMANAALSDKLAVRITGQEIRGDGFVDYSTSGGRGLTVEDRKELSNERFSNYRAKILFAPTAQTSFIFAANRERSSRPYPNDLVAIDTPGKATPGPVSFVNNVNTVLSLTANHKFDDDLSVSGVLSRQTSTSAFKPPVVGNPDPSEYLDFTFKLEQWAFEPKLLYRQPGTRTTLLAGAYLTKRDRTDFGAPGTAFALEADDRSNSVSVFADATIQLASSLDVLVGGRYIEDNQKRVFSGFGGFFAFDFDRREKLFLPKVGLTYHVSADAAVSLLGYKGYNAGGGGVSFVTLTPYRFDKETADTAELAVRTNWLNGRLTVNANAFATRLRGQQTFAIGPGGANDSIILNIDRSRTMGLELDVAYRLGDKSRVGVTIGHVATKIIDFGSAANNGYNGNEFANAPTLTANVYANVEVARDLMIGGNVQLSTAQFSGYENFAEDRVDGYALANINASYALSGVTVQAYVNNIFDSYVEILRTTAFNEQFVRRPRTFGINMTYRF